MKTIKDVGCKILEMEGRRAFSRCSRLTRIEIHEIIVALAEIVGVVEFSITPLTTKSAFTFTSVLSASPLPS